MFYYRQPKIQMSIPKIIHQIWIGPKPRPSRFMDTWAAKNPDFEYILWSESELIKRGMIFLECQKEIDDMSEINGKADIIRWEILYKYGGIFLDADSICIEPLDDILFNKSIKAFSAYENEEIRQGLVATVAMGFPPKHPLCRAAIDWILTNDSSVERTGQRAWITVGPGMITRLMQTGLYPDVTIFPSYFFLPVHFGGKSYSGHGKIYASQEWGSTRQNYETMNQIELPETLNPVISPPLWVSVLVCSYNTKFAYISECLESIKQQNGYFGIELVWIDDGSDSLQGKLLERALQRFQETTRFCKVVYKRLDQNHGVSFALNLGVTLCSHELVMRMDSDDIMLPHRMYTQIMFMQNHPECVLCGSNVQYLHMTDQGAILSESKTNFKEMLTWIDYTTTKPYSHWFMVHPTLCFKKSAILSVGNYNIDNTRTVAEDLELELKILKKYGLVYTIQDTLVYYRIHPDQVTFQGKSSTPYWHEWRCRMIEGIVDQK